MAIIKWEPFGDIENLFDESSFLPLRKLGWDLAVDVYEEGGNVIAKMNLPGIEPDKLDISIDEDSLTISGAREEEKETKNKDYYSKEIRRGSFSRTVELPKEVDAARAEASYADGVLSVTMPETAAGKEKSVKIKVKK